MKKSKIVFAVIAILAVALCVAAYFLLGRGSSNSSGASSINPSNAVGGDVTGPAATSDNPYIDETLPPSTSDSSGSETATDPDATTSPSVDGTVTLGPNVTMQKVDKDPNEVIVRTDEYNPDHPEFTADEKYNYFFSSEGHVYRNDKVITINAYDAMYDITIPISFGYITGGCNRFLYLNPTVESDLADQYGFHFTSASNAGFVETIRSTDNIRTVKNYSLLRALDQKTPANYVDITHPGAVWYTPTSLDGPIYVDCVVMTMTGDWFATIRIHIAKDPADGTYSIVNLENKNLLQEDAQDLLPQKELDAICELAGDVLKDPQTLHMTYVNFEIDNTPKERFLVEYRDASTSLYYNYFIPAGGFQAQLSKEYVYNPVIAVTYRHFMMSSALTLYFEIVIPHTDTEPGVYNYLGRDYPYYGDIFRMQQQNGYPDIN